MQTYVHSQDYALRDPAEALRRRRDVDVTSEVEGE
jgi:hypothetical protein